MVRQTITIALLGTILPLSAQAEMVCNAIYEVTENAQITRTTEVLQLMPEGNLIGGKVSIKNCFYSISGSEKDNEFRVFIVDGNPPVTGAGVATYTAFTNANQMRVSYVKDNFVCKLACARK